MFGSVCNCYLLGSRKKFNFFRVGMGSPAARAAATRAVGAGFQATGGLRRWAGGPRERKSSAASQCVRSFFFLNNVHSVNMLQLCNISGINFFSR